MSGLRDDHYIPQSLLRAWGLDSGQVCYTHKTDNGITLETHSVEEKIKGFKRFGYDRFFNVDTGQPDDLNKYRCAFENKIAGRVRTVLQMGKDHERKLRKDHESVGAYLKKNQKHDWMRFYYLSILMNPLIQVTFESWYREFYRQLYGDGQLNNLLMKANGLRISPTAIVSEEFNNWILQTYNEVHLSFLIPDQSDEYFLAADSYVPNHFYNSLIDGMRLAWVPLHPQLMLRVFFQNVEKPEKDQLQLRFFFTRASDMNEEAIKYGSEVLGAELHKRKIQEGLNTIAKKSLILSSNRM